MARKAVKTSSRIGAQSVKMAAESRFSPLRNLEPETLVQYIESFEAGDFCWLDRTMRAMERRDDTWKVAAAKARKDVARRKWTAAPLDGFERDPAAAAQAARLTAFYASLETYDWNCRNVGSGVRGLVSGMMRAYNDQYSVHELVFHPAPDGSLRGEAVRCPLEWFALRGGRMCLVADGREEQPLETGGWLIAQGDGVGVACAVAYMFKRLALGDWAVYSGRCGHPGIHGKTNAQKGTPQWIDFVAALKAFGREWACATGLDDVIEKIDLSVAGTLPYPGLVERMDRAIAALQRGADLSTMSAGQGSGDGASLQGDEAELITADNCEMVTEACRSQIDPVVLAWYFGDGVEIKAGFRLTPPQRDTIDRDLAIDAQLVSQGVRLSRRDALARYERREADPADTDDSALEIPAVPAPPAPGFPNEADTVRPDPFAKRRNPLAKPPDGRGRTKTAPGGEGALAGQPGASSEAPRIANYEAAAVEALAEARAKGLAPVIDRLLDALGETDEAVMREALAGLLADLPKLAAAAGSDADAGLVERILADAVGIGYHTAMFEEASR